LTLFADLRIVPSHKSEGTDAMSAFAAAADTNSKNTYMEVWLVTIGHAMTHWYPATFYLLLPLIGSELGLSYSQIGSILAIQYAAGAITNVPGGILVDMIGRKGVLMAISLFWVGLPYLLMGFSYHYWMLLTAAALVGIGNNLWHPTAIPWLARRFPDRKGLVVSIHSMGGNVGDALAPMAAGALLTLMSWRDVVLVNVLPGVVMAVLIFALLGRFQSSSPSKAHADDQGHQGGAKTVLRGFMELLKNPTLLSLSASSAFRAMTQNGIMTFLPLYLATQMGYSTGFVGVCMFGLQTAGFIAAPIAGYMSDRIGRRRIIISSMVMSAFVLAGMAFAGQSPLFVIFIAFLGFFLFSIRAVLQAWLLDATPKGLGGSAIGLMFGTQAVGSAIGPLIAGMIADHYGLIGTFYFLASTIVLANMFVFFTPVQTQEAQEAQTAH
jgi:MFS transporter, FSR family, fosmidomycin resistance protein